MLSTSLYVALYLFFVVFCLLWLSKEFMLFFFFQAEDGIRYLVRSRGLGDVYKRQLVALYAVFGDPFRHIHGNPALFKLRCTIGEGAIPVSYTHLTLPTSDLV